MTTNLGKTVVELSLHGNAVAKALKKERHVHKETSHPCHSRCRSRFQIARHHGFHCRCSTERPTVTLPVSRLDPFVNSAKMSQICPIPRAVLTQRTLNVRQTVRRLNHLSRRVLLRNTSLRCLSQSKLDSMAFWTSSLIVWLAAITLWWLCCKAHCKSCQASPGSHAP